MQINSPFFTNSNYFKLTSDSDFYIFPLLTHYLSKLSSDLKGFSPRHIEM